jgi:hypothetical protein
VFCLLRGVWLGELLNIIVVALSMLPVFGFFDRMGGSDEREDVYPGGLGAVGGVGGGV